MKVIMSSLARLFFSNPNLRFYLDSPRLVFLAIRWSHLRGTSLIYVLLLSSRRTLSRGPSTVTAISTEPSSLTLTRQRRRAIFKAASADVRDLAARVFSLPGSSRRASSSARRRTPAPLRAAFVKLFVVVILVFSYPQFLRTCRRSYKGRRSRPRSSSARGDGYPQNAAG